MVTTTDIKPDTSARDLFQAAYENRYTWDPNFPGMTANVSVAIDGVARTGKAKIAQDLSVEVSMDEPLLIERTTRTPSGEEKTVSVDEGQEWLYNQLRDVVTHRKRKSFEDAHGKSSFSLGETDESGSVEILVTGDSMGSNYKVRGNEISMVSRVMGRIGFTINHLGHLDTGEGYVSSLYTAVFRNPMTNEIVRQARFEDTYEKLGNYYVMTKQVVQSHEQGQTKNYEIIFSDIQLLG
ncbi:MULTISPECIES: DUF3386 domain-containing protein [Pseudanabaena]|uniref:DUF3386 domain-containing protein n=2 Tax=Pseudanabaena TaxID=1152 RepID=L8MX25_9CYAN|nr:MULTISPECIES: DUF3386 domain-containing protein [Pseudanabaena]ELS31015.1 hypothetical protein Pse7429DRAFT_3784 [Pseudanabaena biceps PCC 7429]MDG3496713.1 DUF3386 domain-containing protein [Pseudanabaena catenata USMAC16]TYQ30397.1 DUF3386 domain-containing protein [Pseudanabaena sp. UWO310]